MTRPGPRTDGAERWRAAGVRHALLLRVLPALRHDLATPISVVRMTTLLLQRKLAATPVDTAYCVQRLTALDQQTDALTQVMGLLMEWNVDSGGPELETSRAQLVSVCVGLLRPLWALEGVTIEVDPGLLLASDAADPAPAQPCWPRQISLRYLLLGALCYLHDTGAGMGCIRIEPDRHDALWLHGLRSGAIGEGPALAPAACMAEQREEPVCIDAEALNCMAADLGHKISFSADGVWLELATRSDAAGRPATSADCTPPREASSPR